MLLEIFLQGRTGHDAGPYGRYVEIIKQFGGEGSAKLGQRSIFSQCSAAFHELLKKKNWL